MLAKLDVLIVDDEELSCTRIRRMLSGDPAISRIRVAHHGAQALEMIRDLPPDLLFLDIEMPGLSGFGMLKEMSDRERPCVIFVSAYEEYAVRAFDVHALDYLLKPFSRARLQQAMEKVRKEIAGRKVDHSPYPDRFAIRDQGEIQFVRTSEIDWIEAEGRYVRLHAGKRSFLIREGIGSVMQRLQPRKFVRIHRSYIVSLDRVQKMQSLFHGDYRVILQDGTELTLSRNYRSALRELLGSKCL